MPSRSAQFAVPAALAAVLLLLPPAERLKDAHAAGASDEKSDAAQPGATTQNDQTDLSVTVYNSNLALVRDVRQIHLQSGVFPLRFEDVAASIMPATVHFRSLSDPTKLGVVEQNYEYDLLDQNSLLKKYVGRESAGAPTTNCRTARSSRCWKKDADLRQQRRDSVEDRQ